MASTGLSVATSVVSSAVQFSSPLVDVHHEAALQGGDVVPISVAEVDEVTTPRSSEPFESTSVFPLVQIDAEAVSANCPLVEDGLDLESGNAVLLSNNCVVELQGAKHVLHIDHDARRVLAIPLRQPPHAAASPQRTADDQSEGRHRGAIDGHALASLLGRRGPGRPRKEIGDRAGKRQQAFVLSLLLLSPVPSSALLVQVPIEDIPPSLPPSALYERVLATMLLLLNEGQEQDHHQQQQPPLHRTSTQFDVYTDDGALTLNASVAVFDGAPDWVESPVVLPLDKSDPVEDDAFLRQVAARQPADVDEQVRCLICGFSSYYEAHLSEHLLREHSHHETDNFQPVETCAKCGLSVVDRDALLSHYVRRHADLVCEPCGVIVEHRHQMKKHNERHDETAANYCDLCGKRYKDRYILKAHVKSVHGHAEVLYECQLCRKRFERKSHLVRHMKVHAGDVKPFACDKCPYRARERGDLNKHARVHAAPSFRCAHCEKVFTHLKSLRLHEKRHGDVRDYSCALCDFSAFTYNLVRKHIERAHADTVDALIPSGDLAEHSLEQ